MKLHAILFACVITTFAWGQTQGKVTVNVTTATTKKKYAPRHILAIWVENGAGKYVKTLKVQAKPYKRFLKKWLRQSKGDTVDAITGASLKKHTSHDLTWNCKDAKGTVVKDGIYYVVVEFSEKNGAGPCSKKHIKVTKGPEAFEADLKDLKYFRDISVSFTPGA